MNNLKSNLVLIGMPAVGKSTVGVVLAKHLGLNFVDTDLLIQANSGCRLQELIDTEGLATFLQHEEQALVTLSAQRSVIATGGSVIYSPAGMDALRQNGHIIYLEISLDQLKQRLADLGSRGVVIEKNQSLEDLYASRTRLYRQYAEQTIACDRLTPGQVVDKIAQLFP
ncbi:MAG: shikimate kinase [Desulfuromonas sp.]|nr:MAG: shikimate kinase [Desulfuromonas sp.]